MIELFNSRRSWGLIARLLHWGMAALILFQLGLGAYMTRGVSDLAERFDLTQDHKSWGVVIFVLALLRLAWRAVNRTPSPPSGTPPWQAHAAAISHCLFYLLMFALPLSGWVMSASSPVQDLLGFENMVFGTFALPDPWVPGDEALEGIASAVHSVSALTLTLLLIVHTAAALKHQFRDRDDVLSRMTFGGSKNLL